MRPFSTLELIQVARDRGCAVATVEYQNQVTAKISPFTCERSVLRFISQNNGAVYTFRGTSAVLQTEGDRSSIVVLSGNVEARQQKGVKVVPPNWGAVVEGQNHPEFVQVDWTKALNLKTVGNRYFGKINRLNKVYLNEREIAVDETGRFSVPVTNRGNGDVIRVEDALGNFRSYLP